MKSKEIVGEDYEKICISSINDIFNIFYKCFSSRRIPKGKNLKIRGIVHPEEKVEELKEIMLYSVVIAEGPREGNTILVEFPIYREEAFNINVKGDRVYYIMK